MEQRVLRLGVVPYLNVEPVVYGLRGDARFELVRDVPSRVADRLHAAEIDLGMIPSIEYAAGDYAIVPGIAIASRGAVRSVRLFHTRPLEEVRRVCVDEGSRTSAVLLRILLLERLGLEPEYVRARPPVEALLEEADAALAIGDAALYFQGEADQMDLGAEWTALTGLPFVYAFWAGRPGVVRTAEVERLQRSLREGLGALRSIASTYNGLGAGRAAENEAYLRSNIVYDFGEAEAEGLREFYRRAHVLGAIPRVPELRFHGCP